MSDLISRAKAIALVNKAIEGTDNKETQNYLFEGLRRQMWSLPSAEPKTGEWIFNPKDAIESMFMKPKCSKCGFESSDGGNFCPNCGAKMQRR